MGVSIGTSASSDAAQHDREPSGHKYKSTVDENCRWQKVWESAQ